MAFPSELRSKYHGLDVGMIAANSGYESQYSVDHHNRAVCIAKIEAQREPSEASCFMLGHASKMPSISRARRKKTIWTDKLAPSALICVN